MSQKELYRRYIAAINGANVPIVGSVCWWNIRGTDITKERFIELLREVGLPEEYAKEHNYRSAFIRALKNLEEDRIIRRVSEDANFLIYQFTAEKVIGDRKEAKLEYEYETRVIVDKTRYYETRDFSAAIVREIKSDDGRPSYVANPEITTRVIDLYEREKVRYRSSDVTRYIQKILTREADIVSLRDQGSVYFVPARFQDIVEKMSRLVSKISPGGGSSFEYLPVPDVAAARETLSGSVIADLRAAIREFSEQVQEAGPNIPKFMLQRFESRIEGIKRRIGLYDELVPKEETEKLVDEVDGLAAQVFGNRTLGI